MNNISPENTKVGWIGTGVMGQSMCGHLLDAGYDVTVFTRTKSKAEQLITRGARWAESPNVLAESCDVNFTIVGYPHDVKEVILGDDGLLKGCRDGAVIVDMTTSQPSLAKQIAALAAEKNVRAMDAPVSGGDVGAKNAALSIMVGGDQATFERLMPLWNLMGKTIVYQGPAGSGQHTKMVNQTLIATNMIGLCEALLYAYRSGLDLESVMQSVSSGAAGSWSLSNLGPRIIANNFDPGFFVEHFIKDMGIALEEAKQMGLTLPGLELARQLYQSVADQGHEKLGTHALQLALAKMNNIDWVDR